MGQLRPRAVAVLAMAGALPASAAATIATQPPPKPLLAKAQWLVSAPIGNQFFAHSWAAPSTVGGRCYFVTIDHHRNAGSRPASVNGGAVCVAAGAPALTTRSRPLNASASVVRRLKHGRPVKWVPPFIVGEVASTLPVARVVVRWPGGIHELTLRAHRYFVGGTPAMYQQRPYSVIAFDRRGRVAAQLKLG